VAKADEGFCPQQTKVSALHYAPRRKFGEEVPVTLQIALLGSDGVFIASDTKKRTTYHFGNGLAEVDTSESEDKIMALRYLTNPRRFSGF
jgi:hypothetical protein